MKNSLRLYLLFFLVIFSLAVKAQEKYALPSEYKGLSFKDFVFQCEKLNNIKLFYRDEWVKDLRLGDYPACTSLSCVLDNLFKGTSLFYFIDSENVIITKDFAVNVSDEIHKDETFLKPPTARRVFKEDKPVEENAFVEIGNRYEGNGPDKVTISGYVTIRETGDRAPGVNVYVRDQSLGTITNEYGSYTLTMQRGFHEIRFSYIGLKEQKINLNVYGPGVLNVSMAGSVVNLKEIVVSAEKNVLLERTEIGVEKIDIKKLSLLPTSLGEVDIMKSIILLPGVQSVGEGSAGFNVRGGSADQNLILLYGAPVYNFSHFFGFFSSILSGIIKDVTLYKGGIPGKYGGRISSVLEIETKDGNGKEFAGSVGVSPVTAHLIAEGPIITDTLTYMLSARTTYSDWIFGMIESPLLRNSSASFHDLNGKITYYPNNSNKFDASAYYSKDYFSLNEKNIYDYDNKIVALRWLHTFSTKLASTISLNNSSYKYDITNVEVPAEAYSLSHEISSTQFKADFILRAGNNNFNFGLDLTRYSVIPGNYQPAGDSSTIIKNAFERERAFEGAIYLDDRFRLTDFLTLDAGLRFSSFLAMGPRTIYQYSPAYSKTRLTITDTLNFRSGEFPARYAGPEFRASLNFRITDRNSFKINYNRTRQYLHILSNTASISPSDTWKLSDYYLKPATGDQYAVGFYQLLLKNNIETSAEFYYKEIKNMVDFKGGSILAMVNDIEQHLINVKGKAYGMELSLNNTRGRNRFNIGYTYSRTFLKSTGRFRDEIINSGNWYPANYDKPNFLAVTWHYFYSRRLSFSADYTYSTGRPVTIPISYYKVDGFTMIHYSERNKYRIPNYSRLDVSLKVSGNLRTRKIANPNLTFSVYNLLGIQNVYSVYFNRVNEVFRGHKLSIFARAIPTVTFNFDF